MQNRNKYFDDKNEANASVVSTNANTLEMSEGNKYSQFFILVCNIPDENYLTPSQKSIITGLTIKWKRTQSDPHGENIYIIYLDPNDEVDDPKYHPLAKCDNYSKIYIIGHCHPGSAYIYSDPVYSKHENEQTLLLTHKNSKNKESRAFKFDKIGQILAVNIKNKDVILKRDEVTESFNSMARRLRICIPSCFSGVDKIEKEDNNENQMVKKSFAYRLFDYLTNDMIKQLVKCDVVGSTGYVVPLPTQSNIFNISTFVNLMKVIFNYEIQATDFHKRHCLVDNNKLSTIFPRHKPQNMDYKLSFVIPLDTNIKDIKLGNIKGLILSNEAGNLWLSTQMQADKARKSEECKLNSAAYESADDMSEIMKRS